MNINTVTPSYFVSVTIGQGVTGETQLSRCLLLCSLKRAPTRRAEFSRDTDLLVLPGGENLPRFTASLNDVEAECIAVPPELTTKVLQQRPVLLRAQYGRLRELEEALLAEERSERERDRQYWQPLEAELEKIRHAIRKPTPPADA